MILIFQPEGAFAKMPSPANESRKVRSSKVKSAKKNKSAQKHNKTKKSLVAKRKPPVAEPQKPKKIVQISLSKPIEAKIKKIKKNEPSPASAEKKLVELSFAGQGGDAGAEIEPLPQKAFKTNSGKNKRKPTVDTNKSKTIEIKANADETISASQDPFFHKPEDARKVASAQRAKPAVDVKLYEQFQKATEQEIEDDY